MDKANGKTKNTRAAESIFFCKRIGDADIKLDYERKILCQKKETIEVLKKTPASTRQLSKTGKRQ